MQNKKNIIIIGAGYAGLHATRKLSRSLGKYTSITLIDKNDVHIRLAELHEVVGNRIEPKLVTTPIKKYVNHASFLKGEVKKIDFQQRKVSTETDILKYDYLIFAVGSEQEFFNISGMREHSFPLWGLEDVIRIKAHIEHIFASAQKEQDEVKRRELLNFVLCCGGLTGVEIAGELSEWFIDLSRKYNISREQINLILVEALPDILSTLQPILVDKSKRILRSKGVKIMVNSPVTRARMNQVELKSGEKITTRTLIWMGGIRGNHLIDSLELKTCGRNRIEVNKYLQVTDHPGVYAIGDCAYFITDDEKPLPQFVEAALQTADCAANNIIAEFKGADKKAYKPKIHGTVVSIGGKYAVADIVNLPIIRKLTFSGYLAMLLKHLLNIHYFVLDLGDIGLAFGYVYNRTISNR
ncbi:MAG: NAD(P)/FAD-dependent oxidoreductase [Methanocellales archaeon]|nr:NAD(P)/FAD-dependent oxidoreductase [Methanocellales archaeon]